MSADWSGSGWNGDTMHGGRGCGDFEVGPGGARVHGVLLVDVPSAEVPPGQTITIAEWWRQQKKWGLTRWA